MLYDLIKQDVKIYSSIEILSEYKKILKRDFKFSEDDVTVAIEKILSFIILIEPTVKVFIENDPDDSPIVECAIESKSKYIITYDKHLLNLKEYEGIQIIKPEIARAIF